MQSAESIAPPQILSQPQPQITQPGALASFFVVAANTRGLGHQWRYNGANLAEATNDALLLQNVGAINEGQYSVVLANSSGSVTSAPALLMLDGDRDSLPDSWELASFGNLNQYPTGDFDGDGVSNRDELLDGTNPADSASARFRLTVLSSGGSVTVVPARLSYTNGEVVTLTATAFAPNTFRGWTGATNTTSNPLTLTMTTNKTVFARQGSENLVWVAGNGDWHGASNWEPPFVPTTNDNAIITSAVTVTVNSPAECGSLTFGSQGVSPNLTGTGTLTVHRDSTWTSGQMTGSGRTLINPGATLLVDIAGIASLTGCTLENAGHFVWAGAGNINLGSGAVITNRAGALFEMRNAGTLFYGGGANSRFDNAGTVRKSINPGSITVDGQVAFNNYGAVEIQTGTLRLDGGGTHTGDFDVPTGTTLYLGGGIHNAGAASSITGAGNFTVNGGTATLAGLVHVSGLNFFDGGTANLNGSYICTNNTLTIAGGTANFNGSGTVTPTILNISSGTLGGSQGVTVLSQINWTGGSMLGTGRTILSAGVTLNLANSVILSGGRILENRSSVFWTSGGFNFGAGSVLTNVAGALFEAQGAGAFGHIGGAVARFDNAGTFRKSINPGTTTVDGQVNFNNHGTVEILTGTLSLNGGGTHTGTFDVPAGTTLYLAGVHNAGGGSSITGGGNFTVNGGTVTLAGLVNVSGLNLFDGGTANLTGNYICTNNTLTIAGATANFNGSGTVTPTVLNLSSGILGGSQVVTVLSQMNWTGGTMIGSGRTIIPVGGALSVASPSSVTLSARTLENGGTVLWTSGNMNVTGCVITNRPGALFEATAAVGLIHNGGLDARFDNAGTFRKSINPGTTTVGGQVNFNNYSTVEILTGTLSLNGGGTHTGTFDVPAGTTLYLAGIHNASGGSSITGAGNFTVNGGTATLAGLVHVSGLNFFDGGTANLTGNYICTNNTLTIAGATANFNGSGTVAPTVLNLSSGTLGGSQTVMVLGVLNWTGGAMSGAGRTIILPGATLNLAHATGVTLTTRTLENGGTVIWTSGFIGMSAAVITNRAGALFENRGLGSLSFNGGTSRFDNAGTFRKSVNTGTMPVTTSVIFNNYNTVEIQSGILAPSGGYNSTANSLLNCTIGGTSVGTGYGRLQVSGAVTLNGSLRVGLTNAFVPTTNDTFTVLTAGTRSGSFANFSYPSNEVSMLMSNTANSVIVRVTEVLAGSQPRFLSSEISGPDIRLIWTALSNRTYRVEYNSDLSLTNWLGLPGDITTLSNTASKLDLLTPSNRFYRVLVVP